MRRALTIAVALTLSLLAGPPAAGAQPAGKVYRVGVIANAAPLSEMAGPEPVGLSWRAFVQGLRALGYVEGQNLILERRSAEGRYERFGDIAAELGRLKADVIVTASDGVPRVGVTLASAECSLHQYPGAFTLQLRLSGRGGARGFDVLRSEPA